MMSHVREHEAPANLCSRRLPDHAVADPERPLRHRLIPPHPLEQRAHLRAHRLEKLYALGAVRGLRLRGSAGRSVVANSCPRSTKRSATGVVVGGECLECAEASGIVVI
jgi:hypothetical protein